MTQKRLTRSLEIDPEEIDRVEALVPAMVEDPLVRAAGRVTAARVLRYALVEGLAVLEERYEMELRQAGQQQGGTPTSQPAPRPKLDINPADIDPDTGFLSEDAIVGQEREAAGVGDE